MSKNRKTIVVTFIVIAIIIIVVVGLLGRKNTLLFQVPANDVILEYSVTLVETQKNNHDVVFVINASSNKTMSNNSINHILPGLGTIKFDTRKATGTFHVASWVTLDELKKIIKSSSLIINDSKDSIKLESIIIKESYINPNTIKNYRFGNSTPQ